MTVSRHHTLVCGLPKAQYRNGSYRLRPSRNLSRAGLLVLNSSLPPGLFPMSEQLLWWLKQSPPSVARGFEPALSEPISLFTGAPPGLLLTVGISRVPAAAGPFGPAQATLQVRGPDAHSPFGRGLPGASSPRVNQSRKSSGPVDLASTRTLGRNRTKSENKQMHVLT